MTSSYEFPCPVRKHAKVTHSREVSLQASEGSRHPTLVVKLPSKVPVASVRHVEGNDDMLHEILKHLDAQTLASSSCVNRRWRKAAENQSLWENICARCWPETFSRPQQLKSVVTALGGFRRLYTLCLHPLLPRSDIPPQQLPCPSTSPSVCNKGRVGSNWGDDEFHLSLSLFSIDCYERLNRRNYNLSSLGLLREPPSLQKTIEKWCAVRSKAVEGRMACRSLIM